MFCYHDHRDDSCTNLVPAREGLEGILVAKTPVHRGFAVITGWGIL
jgi:hypothetical protein